MTESTPDAARRERNRRLAITTGILVLLALVIATGVWVTSGSSSTTPDPAAAKTPPAHRGDHSLVVGAANAPVKVVVYEDFLCPFCRQLETSTRDFLHQDAAKGRVQVEYRPFQLLPDDYSRRALDAWATVLQHGTPAQALRFHDLLYDEQPYEQAAHKPGVVALRALARKAGVTDPKVLDAFGSPNATFFAAVQRSAERAGVRGTPTVLVDGKPLGGSSIQDLADRLEQLAAG